MASFSNNHDWAYTFLNPWALSTKSKYFYWWLKTLKLTKWLYICQGDVWCLLKPPELNFGPLSPPLCPCFPQDIEKIFSIVKTVTSHIPLFNHSQTVRASKGPEIFTKWSPHLMCHVSFVTCHMSYVTCHVWRFRLKKK